MSHETKAMANVRREWVTMMRVRSASIKAHLMLRPEERDYPRHAERVESWRQRSDSLLDSWLALRWGQQMAARVALEGLRQPTDPGGQA